MTHKCSYLTYHYFEILRDSILADSRYTVVTNLKEYLVYDEVDGANVTRFVVNCVDYPY